MTEERRGQILGYVGGIGVANEAYSGNLAISNKVIQKEPEILTSLALFILS